MSTPSFEPVGDAVEALKATFRRHASGVAILTALDAQGQPVAFTATSVTSLGTNPPLVSFNVARGSSSWPAISEATHVAMHTLGTENLELAKKMSQDHTQRFVDTDWEAGPFNLPVLAGVTSVLILRIRQVVSIEANAVLIADVVDGFIGAEQRPLLYFKRDYSTASEL
jgi:flavin reductase (DIM6/NTAB) family NADH-FMN oxidoreductase RutF